MDRKLVALLLFGIAAIVLFVPASICQPNPMWPDHATNPQMCVSVPAYEAISLGWESAQFSMVAAIALCVFALYLLVSKPKSDSESE
jgi:hypothetical protein